MAWFFNLLREFNPYKPMTPAEAEWHEQQERAYYGY